MHIGMQTVYPDDSMTNPEYTYHFDKLSCSRTVWFVHITFAFLVVLSGFGCLLTRLSLEYKWMHPWFGRCYIIFLLWCMGTSLIIHNSGLPIAVLVSFTWVLCGLSFGWIAIKFHQIQMEREIYRLVNYKIIQSTESEDETFSIENLINDTRKRIAQDRTFCERILSYKALHGALMFTSFINVAGRTVAFNGTGDFSCHTYPYYKQINTSKFNGLGQSLTAVPLHDPKFDKLPWANGVHWWAIELSILPMILALSVGSCFAWNNSKCKDQRTTKNFTDIAGIRLDSGGSNYPRNHRRTRTTSRPRPCHPSMKS